ncbi:UDP-2,4-diacetamido-2,4,6-trideoxy-beta-L-altropyranose hydrolase [Azospirillum thermophilum]|uniref:UDP-2,4-diacetamido-2,4, 6-trideoxy-beta-L-altropyranose hydrolase n=1 Tax=Azospirillum thermophilum TaxID=2202148 RepID=A0A2S2CMA1_9PROT|nr:UDP-2,4-diacetamido-2,4,6-trideoxy-beta-L-altropyranose hydrolase [Azospirillum thermophilum]AWK85500.1 UDP-2,4-diacetamido-2,4,6-trideoxy-beta-L-altropyranose hydrolase [Azospirillum thermophilum]
MTTVLVRADASAAIGTGHVMRCLAVAEVLRGQGCRIQFAMAESTPAIDARLAAAGIGRIMVPGPIGDAGDLAATRAALRRDGAAAVMIDGYGFGDDYRAGLKASGARVLAWDDLADGPPLHADLVVNPAPQAERLPYDRLAPGAGLLLGPAHVPFRREIRLAAARPRPPMAERRTLLLTFGGSDPLGLTGPVLEGLAAERPEGCRILAVVGGSNPRVADLLGLAERLEAPVTVEVDSTRMGAVMAGSGLAVSAGGGTQGELALMAVPTLLVVIADNQAPASAGSAALGWCEAVDGRGPDAVPLIVAAAMRLWRDPDRRRAMAEKAMALPLDGEGAVRIAQALLSGLR